jgi:hypothetical protein
MPLKGCAPAPHEQPVHEPGELLSRRAIGNARDGLAELAAVQSVVSSAA